MGRAGRNCLVLRCETSNLAKLSNHLVTQVHNMDTEEQKQWLKWSKIGICVPLKGKDANEKDIHMANILDRLVNLHEEIDEALIAKYYSNKRSKSCTFCVLLQTISSLKLSKLL